MATVFDEEKDKSNLADHGVSLSRAEDFDFTSAYFDLDDREDYGEVRWNAIGFLDARLFSLTFTERDGDLRAISLRTASREERKRYAQEDRKRERQSRVDRRKV